MRREAEMHAKSRLDEATDKVRSIVAEYDRLVREKNQFLRKIKVAMESELAVVSETLDMLPDPEREEHQLKATGTQAEPLQKAIQEQQPAPAAEAMKNEEQEG